MFGAVAPFWREFQQHDPEQLSYLWLMRYGKGGEHLKVRVHGPESQRTLQQRLLEEKATTLLASLAELVEPPAKGWVGAPPIDIEDEVDEDYPDRTLLWTTYRRNHVSLGGKPFLTDDRYAALFTRCLASGCEIVLSLQPEANLMLAHRVRQSTLLKALIAGLAAVEFPAEKRAAYLSYHRDWLLRFILPKDRRAENEPVEQLRQRFDERIEAMKDSLLPLRKAAELEWDNCPEGAPSQADGPGTVWRRSLTDLLEYVLPFCADPDYQLDPFASDPVFSPIFKVFHGFANQLGLKLTDEAFAHHILLWITTTSVRNGRQ